MGISYDSPEVLKRAASKHQITFPLLSDEGSKTIDAYGIRNQEATGRFAGIPHPTTFVVDDRALFARSCSMKVTKSGTRVRN